jgi:glycosyltransferase involved in cell wall biosynthesis
MARLVTVLHLIEGLGTGGSEQHLAHLVLHSDRSRFRHHVCGLGTAGRFAQVLEAAGIPVYTLGYLAQRDFLRPLRPLRRLVQRVRPDVLHACLYRPGVLARLIGRWSGLPVVTTLVNTAYEPEWRLDNPRLSPLKVFLARTLDAATARWRGAWFVAVSETVRDSAVRQLGIPAGRVRVIRRPLLLSPNGQRPSAPAVRAALGLPDADPLLLNVGRLVPQKGQQYAVRAMPRILASRPGAHLVIVGEGPLRPSLAALAEALGVADHVTLLGERHDVPDLLAAADCFLFPSLSEGAANALMEALAAGTPVVASDIPSLRELTDDGRVAALVPLRAPEALAEAVLGLLADDARRRRLCDAGKAWVRRWGDGDAVRAWEEFVARIVEGA